MRLRWWITVILVSMAVGGLITFLILAPEPESYACIFVHGQVQCGTKVYP